MKTTKVIPIEIGRMKLMLQITVDDPLETREKVRKTRVGKRLPDNMREDIETKLRAGVDVKEIVKETCVSIPTVYTIRTRLLKSGEIPYSSISSSGSGRRRGRPRNDEMVTVSAASVDDILGGEIDDEIESIFKETDDEDDVLL